MSRSLLLRENAVLTRAGNGAIWQHRDSEISDYTPTVDQTWSPQEAEQMNAKILTFSSHGDTTLLEYDPATADLEEVNKLITE
jgi:hypothetical protein